LQVYNLVSNYIVSEYDDKQLTLLGFCKNGGEKIYEVPKYQKYDITILSYSGKERNVFISSFINSKFFLIDSLIQSSDFTFGMPLRLVLEVLQDSILNVILSSKPYLTWYISVPSFSMLWSNRSCYFSWKDRSCLSRYYLYALQSD
jgi:hypothetical protein